MKKLIVGGTPATEKNIQAVLKGDTTKSAKMKALFDLGLEVREITEVISKHEGSPVRYNFVYNVVSNYCNMNGIQVVASENARGQIKEAIIAGFLSGKSNKEICIDLKTNANYVFNVLKAYKLANPPKTHDVSVEEQAQ